MSITHAATVNALVDTATATADAHGGTGSLLIAVTLLSPYAAISGDVRAYIGALGDASVAHGALFSVGSLDVEAKELATTATATLLTLSIGLIGAGVGATGDTGITADAELGGTVAAWASPFDSTATTPQRAPLTITTGGATIGATSVTSALTTTNGGAGSFGIAIAIVEGDANNAVQTTAYLDDSTTLTSHGLAVTSNGTTNAKVTGTVGEASVIAGGGKLVGKAGITGGVDAYLGDKVNVTVTDGDLLVQSQAAVQATTDMLIATANLVAGGRDVDATTTITHSTTASIGGAATVTTIKTTPPGIPNGDLTVQAIAAAEGDAKAQTYGGSLLVDAQGASGADTTVTPTVSATVGAGTHLKAAGSAKVAATYQPSGAPPSTQIIAVDTLADTLKIDLGLHLGDGDVITYDPGSSPIQPLQPYTTFRNYPVIVVSSDTAAHTSLIQLGAIFSASAIDPVTDTIHFASAHPFVEGDQVVLGSPLETFDPSAVDDATDSFLLSVPTNLVTGDAVVYRNHAGAPVTGLTNGTTYYVIVGVDHRTVRLAATRANALLAIPVVVPIAPTAETGELDGLEGVLPGVQPNTSYIVHKIDDLTIKLTTGLEAAPKSFTGGNVSGNTITITNHGFVDGQAVTYTDPGLGVSFTSQLVDAFVVAGHPAIDAQGNTTYLPSLKSIYLPSTFATGDLVRYGAPVGGTAITGLVNGHDYRVLQTAADTSLGYIQLAAAAVFNLFGLTFTADSTNGDTIVLGSGLHWADFGFAAGQVITVVDTGIHNGTFTIASVSNSTLRLQDKGVVTNGSVFLAGEVYSGLISLARPAVSPGVPDTHTLTRVSDLPISGLTTGVTYYVKYLTSNTFQLAAAPGGTTLPIDGTGRTATHTIGTTGLDLGVASGTHNLHLDLTSHGERVVARAVRRRSDPSRGRRLRRHVDSDCTGRIRRGGRGLDAPRSPLRLADRPGVRRLGRRRHTHLHRHEPGRRHLDRRRSRHLRDGEFDHRGDHERRHPRRRRRQHRHCARRSEDRQHDPLRAGRSREADCRSQPDSQRDCDRQADDHRVRSGWRCRRGLVGGVTRRHDLRHAGHVRRRQPGRRPRRPGRSRGDHARRPR